MQPGAGENGRDTLASSMSIPGDEMNEMDGVSFNSFSRARVLPGKVCRGASRIVPLLDPMCVGGCSVGVPFVTEIELHGDGCSEGMLVPPVGQGEDVYELRFVLHGRGRLRYRDGFRDKDSNGETMVETGDAILMRHGVGQLQGVPSRGDEICSMATFVTYMPMRLLERDSMNSLTPHEFSVFGRRHLWDGEAACKLSDIMEKEALGGLLSGATLWMDHNGQMATTSVDLTGAGDSVDDAWGTGMDAEYPSAFESVDDVEPSFATPDSTISQDIDIQDVYHTQITSSMTYELPNQTNRLALLFDPFADTPVPFVFGVEIFEPGHRTTPHVHESAFEVFFILSGEGEGFCNGKRFALTAGDVVAFHPGAEHGIDNGTSTKMYCIEMMMPDEEFAQFVRAGRLHGLRKEELCVLRRIGCK